MSIAHFLTQDGNTDRIISGSTDHTIKIWDRDPQQGVYRLLQTLGVANNQDHVLGHSYAVWSVAHLGEDHIISGSGDKTIKIWSPNQQGIYTCLQTLGGQLGHTRHVMSIAVHGNLIISCSVDQTIKIWGPDPQQGVYRLLHTLGVANNENPELGHTDYVESVVVNNRDHRIISGSFDSTIKIWDIPL